MSHVDIAMATYNGEKYIEEQILSIINQSYSSWNLYISDDGSTDRTVEIIKKFEHLDSRIKLINTDRQGGVVQNFNKALEATAADYILLSDQDDFWLKDRVEIMLDRIMQEELITKKPILIFSNLVLVDKDLNVISEDFYRANGLDPQQNLKVNNLIWISTVYGCSTIFNRQLLNKSLPIPSNVPMHDNWLALNAATEMGIYYLNTPTIKYRQHENNVVGGSNKSSLLKIKTSLRTIKKIIISINKYKAMLELAKLKPGNEVLLNINLHGRKKIAFCFLNVMPKIFSGNKKVLSLFMFLGLILK